MCDLSCNFSREINGYVESCQSYGSGSEEKVNFREILNFKFKPDPDTYTNYDKSDPDLTLFKKKNDSDPT